MFNSFDSTHFGLLIPNWCIHPFWSVKPQLIHLTHDGRVNAF